MNNRESLPHISRHAAHARSCFLCLSLLVLTACGSPEEKSYQAFLESAKKSANPEILQEQTASLLSKHEAGKEIPISELPSEVKKLSESTPVFAFVVGQEGAKEKALMISWGNGFAHWGVIVGPPSFEFPKMDRGEITVWAPGVIFFFQ